MKKIILSSTLILFSVIGVLAQDVTGKWKTIDDNTGEAKSIVEIFKKDGKMYGKVVEILNKDKKDAMCIDCPGDAKGQRIEGLVILKDLKKDGNEYKGGTIMDPNSGKVYKSHMALDGADKLKVRGYVGFSLLGRTQVWQRVK